METKLQKICDSADWFDSELRDIIVNNLRLKPRLHRKQWEFAMIFRALNEAGVLNKNNEGIAFGAGEEVLIYSIMEQVKKLTATDLYQKEAAWSGTKTDDPKQYILEKAPFPVQEQNLEAHYMDMRKITYPDNTFDFAYSSCAFEHISDNDEGFIEHLKEVNRTLKEGGVYAMTTEFVYAEETIPLDGNYFFELTHLLELIRASGLHAASKFDASLVDISTNLPTVIPSQFDFPIGNYWMPHVTCVSDGITFTSCLLILTKDSSKKFQLPKIIGLQETKQRVYQNLDMILNKLWKNWQNIGITRIASDMPSLIGHDNFIRDIERTEEYAAFMTPFFDVAKCQLQVKIRLLPQSNEQLKIRLHSFKGYQGNDLKIDQEIIINCKKNEVELIELECDAIKGRIYSIVGRGKGIFEEIDIKMRCVSS